MTLTHLQILEDVLSGYVWRSRDDPKEAALRASMVSWAWGVIQRGGVPTIPNEFPPTPEESTADNERHRTEWPKDRLRIPKGSDAERLSEYFGKAVERLDEPRRRSS